MDGPPNMTKYSPSHPDLQTQHTQTQALQNHRHRLYWATAKSRTQVGLEIRPQRPCHSILTLKIESIKNEGVSIIARKAHSPPAQSTCKRAQLHV